MTMAGSAFLIMWHDISPEGDSEYNLWHTREHMPERIALPGFTRARRGINREAQRQTYFTLYEGDNVATFSSPEYLQSLNYPTSWTSSVAPTFRNFLRMVCIVAASSGEGEGGAIATLRCTWSESAAPSLDDVIAAITALTSVTAVHTGTAEREVSGRATTETALRPEMAEPGFDQVIVVEGIGRNELERDAAAICAACRSAGFADVLVQTYDVAYTLTRSR